MEPAVGTSPPSPFRVCVPGLQPSTGTAEPPFRLHGQPRLRCTSMSQKSGKRAARRIQTLRWRIGVLQSLIDLHHCVTDRGPRWHATLAGYVERQNAAQEELLRALADPTSESAVHDGVLISANQQAHGSGG